MKSLPTDGSHFLICLVINTFICFVICGLVKPIEAHKAVSITRHYQGDLYHLKESNHSLQSTSCECGSGSFQVGPSNYCQCQCFRDKPTLRDDTLECVNELAECVLAEFVSSTQAEKIPYVYIPNNGQLIHPTAEIALLGLNNGESQVVTPVCIVTNGQFLNQNGWQDMRNSSTFEAPFRLQPDAGKTYLQWTGDHVEKVASRGRVILVQLLCRDAAKSQRTLLHPCVAFRVAGSPDAEELFFMQETLLTKDTNNKVLSTGEALAIGLVLGGLIIAYILVSIVYWRIKQNKGDIFKFSNGSKQMEEGTSIGTSVPTKGYMTRNVVREVPSGAARKAKTLPKTSLVSSEDDSDCDDLEDLSKKHKYSKNKENDNTTTAADVHDDEEEIYSIPSELEELEGRRLRLERLRIELESQKSSEGDNDRIKYEISPSVFGFSVNDSLGTTSSGARALGVIDPSYSCSGDQVDSELNETQMRKKLYFNPAYFEPENLQSPPPAAVEFLTKIREMISVAKNRMQTKSFQPSLIDIPEDDYSSQASRATSIASNTRASSQQTFTLEELEECEKELANGPIYSIAKGVTDNNILEVCQADDTVYPSNTLKRLAQRVNTHGQTLVSEIVQTLDLKPRLPDAYYNPYPLPIPTEPAPPRPNLKPVNSSGENIRKCETVFPELVKPSMLRNATNKNAGNSPEPTNKFENLRQEIRSTLSKVIMISPVSSLNRNKITKSQSNDRIETKNSAQGENKVQKWLQSLDGKNNSYSKIYDVVSCGFGSKQSQELSTGEGSKPRIPSRTVSFSHTRQLSLSLAKENHPNESIHNASVVRDNALKHIPSVFRSQSLIKDPVKVDSFQRRQRTPSLDDNKNYATSSLDDSLNSFVNNAILKVPKMYSGDTDNILSDAQSKFKDSLENNNLSDKSNPNDIDSLSNGTTPLSILQETNVNTNGTGMYGNPFHSDDPEIPHENSYEEIHFGTVSIPKIPAALKISDARVKKHVKEIHVRIEEIEDAEKCGMFSNPDTLVSEILIFGENPIGMQSLDNRLSIELTDNVLSSDSDCREHTNSSENKKKKKIRKVKRNDSVLQDSLERPKIKKKICNEEGSQSVRNEEGSQYVGNEEGSQYIGNEESDNRETQLPKEEYHLSEAHFPTDDPTKVKRSQIMRTFKDYKIMQFNFNSSSDNRLSVVGDGIHFTYRTPSPSEISLSSLSTITKPPLPPKPLKCNEELQVSLDSSINSMEDSAPSIPPKHKLRYSASLSSDLHHKSLRNLSSTSDVAPKLPPKVKHRNSFSDTNCHIRVLPESSKSSVIEGNNDDEPPKLPEKSRRRSNSLLAKSSSRGSIPELTEEEANSILNGVLAHSPSLDSSISDSLYSQEQNFLDNGNIANESDSTFVGNVPDIMNEQFLKSENSKENILNTSNEKTSCDAFDEDYQILTPGEEFVRGQFILSNSRPPTLQRHPVNGEPSNEMAQIKEMTANLELLEKGLDGTLAIKIKTELEKHFIEKSGADSIKRAWRKVLEKVDSNEKLTLKDLQKYILSLRLSQTKIKNEDSGYHSSTDSNDSSRIRKSKLTEQFRLFNLKTNLRRSGTIAIPSGLRKKTVGFFQQSSSLQQLISGSMDINLLKKDSLKFGRNKLTSSMERRKDVNPRLSVYINNSFSIEAN